MTNTFRQIVTEAMQSILNEADDTTNFVSVAQQDNSFDTSKLNANIYDDENEMSEDKQEEKSKLTTQAIEKIKDSLKVSDELQSILNRIKKINDEMDINEWKVNEEDNTAILKNKNARIFKQNDNLCLSHDGKVELFKSVTELHDWLKNNNYPLPHNIKLHEAVLKEVKLSSDYQLFNTSDIIPQHVNDDVAFRMKMYLQDSPWSEILANRWNDIGTQSGEILGYDFGTDEDENSENYIKSVETNRGTMYYDKRDLNPKKNTRLYLEPNFYDMNLTPSAYLHPNGEITTQDVYGLPKTPEDAISRSTIHKDEVKMGKDATKAAMNQAGFKQVASQINKVRDTNLGAFNDPAWAKKVDKVGIDRAEKYLGDVSQSGEYCLDVNGKPVGIVKNNKVWDLNEPTIKIGKVGLQGHCYMESNLKEDQVEDLWYLKYENSDLDQNYLNNTWRKDDLLAQNLDSAAKFATREDAINELRELYNTKTTQFPFKPINVNEMSECGACGATTASLGSAVQYVGNRKKKAESINNESELDEGKVSSQMYDLQKQRLPGSDVVTANGTILGKVTDRLASNLDVDLPQVIEVLDTNGQHLGTSKKEYPLAKTLEGDTIGYVADNRVWGAKNKQIGNVKNSTVYDTKGNKIGIVTEEEPYNIVKDDAGYAIGYIDLDEVFDFNDNLIGSAPASDDNKYRASLSDDRRYIWQDLEGNDAGYVSLQGIASNFNGKKVGEAHTDLSDVEGIYDLAKKKAIEKAQIDFFTNIFGKVVDPKTGRQGVFNPYNKAGKIKDLYANAINPGNYATANLFGGLFDTLSSEPNKLLVSPEEFKARIEQINKMHGLNLNPDEPIYPRKSASPHNQKELNTLLQNYIRDVASRKSEKGAGRSIDKDEEKFKTTQQAKTNAPEFNMNKNKEIQQKALQAFDAGNEKEAKTQIRQYLKSIYNNNSLSDVTKKNVYNDFLVFSKQNGLEMEDEIKDRWLDESFSSHLLRSLKEADPTPADFADGGSQDTSLADVTTTSQTSTQQTTDDTVSDGLNDYGPEDSDTPIQFGDVNINGGNGVPNEDEEQTAPIPEVNEKIIDVLVNEKDPSQIKLKVKNLDTGEVTIKDLNEIDV